MSGSSGMSTTRTKSKGSKKPVPKIPVPEDGNDQNSDGFFLGPEDMVSPDGGENLAARCGYCETEAGEAETHWIVDFRAALLEGSVDTREGGYIITPLSLINLNLEVHGTGPVSKRAAVLKVAS